MIRRRCQTPLPTNTKTTTNYKDEILSHAPLHSSHPRLKETFVTVIYIHTYIYIYVYIHTYVHTYILVLYILYEYVYMYM